MIYMHRSKGGNPEGKLDLQSLLTSLAYSLFKLEAYI